MKENHILLICIYDSTLSSSPNASRFRSVLDVACETAGKNSFRSHNAAASDINRNGSGFHIVTNAEETKTYLETYHKTRQPGDTLRILFAVLLPADGISHALTDMLRLMRNTPSLFETCLGGVIVDGADDLYTKSAAVQLVFAANSAGCAFVGRPLVEATGSLQNFTVTANNLGTGLSEAYEHSVRMLVKTLLQPDVFFVSSSNPHSVSSPKNRADRPPRLLALHASSHEKSNTYALWRAVKEQLTGIDTSEIGLRNGVLVDCSGCPFNMCLHFGENDSCFYGGVMVDDVYPALRETDAVLMICPNYNDAISANLTAFINRLTAMYRKHPFSDKALFAIVVSGYSGTDIVAGQLIAALNMNKSFYLPPRFVLTATANDPGSAMKTEGMNERISAFAEGIRNTLL